MEWTLSLVNIASKSKYPAAFIIVRCVTTIYSAVNDRQKKVYL